MISKNCRCRYRSHVSIQSKHFCTVRIGVDWYGRGERRLTTILAQENHVTFDQHLEIGSLQDGSSLVFVDRSLPFRVDLTSMSDRNPPHE